MSASILAPLFLGLAIAPAAETALNLSPSTTETLRNAFKSICFDNFATPEAIPEAIQSDVSNLVLVKKTGLSPDEPGGVWRSESYEVAFTNSDHLPRNIPSVQCSVSALISTPVAHPESAATLATLLNLGKGKIGKDKPRSQSRWDIKDKKWRIFHSIAPEGEVSRVRFTLLKLAK